MFVAVGEGEEDEAAGRVGAGFTREVGSRGFPLVMLQK